MNFYSIFSVFFLRETCRYCALHALTSFLCCRQTLQIAQRTRRDIKKTKIGFYLCLQPPTFSMTKTKQDTWFSRRPAPFCSHCLQGVTINNLRVLSPTANCSFSALALPIRYVTLGTLHTINCANTMCVLHNCITVLLYGLTNTHNTDGNWVGHLDAVNKIFSFIRRQLWFHLLLHSMSVWINAYAEGANCKQ